MAIMRQCGFCGSRISVHLTKCNFCCRDLHAYKPELDRQEGGSGGPFFRRGLYIVALAGVIRFLISGRSPITIPFEVSAIVPGLLLPALFILGGGLIVWGVLRSFMKYILGV